MNEQRAASPIRSDRWTYLWLVLGCVLMVFMAGNWPLALAGWLAPVFSMRFMRTQRRLRGYLLLALGLAVANTIEWQGGAGPAIVPAPIFGAMLGLLYGLLFLVERVLVRRLEARGRASFATTLVFPTLMAGYEFLWFNKLIFGSSGSWAYTQHSNLVLMQVISLTGLWGLTFLITWFAAVVNWAWERGLAWPEIRRGAAIYGGVLLLILAFGNVRLRFFTPQAGTVRVHAVAGIGHTATGLDTEMVPLVRTDREAYRRLAAGNYDACVDAATREARAGAQIVVFPETAAVGVREDLDALIARLQEVATTEKVYLAVGIVVLDTDIMELRVLVIAPSGEVVLNHLKYAYGQGTPVSQVVLQTVDTPYGRLSGVACGDLDNPGVISQAGRKGVDILLVPATEDPSSGPWHYRLAPFRAVENGFSLVRATIEGASLASDPYGRLIAFVDYFSATERVTVAQVPTHRVRTVFATVGNVFGWLAVVAFVGLAAWAIVGGRRARNTAP